MTTKNTILQQIQGAELLNQDLHSDDFPIAAVNTLQDATPASLTWVSTKKFDEAILRSSLTQLVIIGNDISVDILKTMKNKLFIRVANPRLEFIRIAERLFTPAIEYTISQHAVIHPEAVIAEQVRIGHHTVIGRCKIDSGTVIHDNCTLYDDIEIGKNVIIHANTVIGSDGFGYQKNELGELEKFPHLGGVRIEDHVEIGSNTSIDRGTLGHTRICKGAKIDNLVHVAHNVIIGENTTVIAHAMIGGSTVIGHDTWIAPNAILREGIRIGNHVTVGLGAVVTKNIPDGETWIGNPGKEISESLKQANYLKKLIQNHE
ncbi:MAG: UDP-3-O-(3-hydroxymyristoyl)glucosamine N-acyltransferase [Chitinophagaceae bacterium]|nr:UDP-3-O-(3-hydroxymyristoyl)glucosamine N-acyltransferase [Chitinophagaceae bacterium]